MLWQYVSILDSLIFFITFTCNPKWPEIIRYVKARKLKAEDRSDIICRIFKIKLDSLMDTLTKKNILGETQSCKLNMSDLYIYKNSIRLNLYKL